MNAFTAPINAASRWRTVPAVVLMASCLWLASSSSSALMRETSTIKAFKRVQPAEFMTGSRARRRQTCDMPTSPERKKQIRSPTCASSQRHQRAPHTTEQSEAELAEYKSLTVPAPAVDPLAFWKQKTEQLPIMSLTARRLLCASTSSTQSEQDLQFLWCL